MAETFGQMVFREREVVRGWKQKELARRTGLDQSTISAIERGRSTPRAATITLLARALRFDASPWLVQFGHIPPPAAEEAPPAPTPSDYDRAFDVAEIVALIEQLPGEEYRRRLFAMREGHTDAEWVALCVLFFRAQQLSAVTMLDALERLGGRNQHG